MHTILALLVILLLAAVALLVRQVRRLNGDVVALYALLRAPEPDPNGGAPADTNLRLLRLEAAERARQLNDATGGNRR